MVRNLNAKNEKRDSAQPQFWSERYATGKTPWQMDHVPKRLEIFIRSLHSGANVLIPGCGEDFRAIDAFHRAGHYVRAIDFSPIAVEYTRNALPELGHKIILGDFFRHDFGDVIFDVVYERTFLCSLPPRLWRNYAKRVSQLLRSDGRLAGFFFYGNEPEPPPYPLTESKAFEIFRDRFDLKTTERVSDSLPIFARQEKWQEWQLRPNKT